MASKTMKFELLGRRRDAPTASSPGSSRVSTLPYRNPGYKPSDDAYRVIDLPYQGQLVPFAAILAIIGPKFDHAAVRDRLARWFWCGIFGELYGSAIESRFAKDVLEVPVWLNGGPEPSTINDGRFRPERLRTLRTRLSAAYKGIHALLMAEGAIDFRSGQPFDQTVFFDEYVDIHHIFPQDWCKKQKIETKVFDTVINKTPLSYKTNRILGGVAPSEYLARLEKGGKDAPPIDPAALDDYLASHAMAPGLLRANDFAGFMADRENRLLAMIARATGHPVSRAEVAPEEGARMCRRTMKASTCLPQISRKPHNGSTTAEC